ncbi:prolyl oligopeptidase family serine peptidase [Steroidobacter flavus]|uniref:Prolyl oligopeptidase family serine peptidase n=1 Tax=Steroidobacter flavus TaxID=1842136 RepID=A0ABV8T1N2_9GAMM
MKTAALATTLALSIATAVASENSIKAPARSLTPPASVTSPSLPGAAPVPLADLFDAAASNNAVWSADGRSVIYSSNQTGRMNLWSVPVDGGPAKQLNSSERRQQSRSVTPDGKWVIFQSDEGGREIYDLYALPATGGEPVNLTASDDINEALPIVSFDSKLMAYSARRKSESSDNVAVMDLATRKLRYLTDEKTSGVQWIVAAFTGDGRTLLANRYDYSLTFGEVYKIDVASGAATRLSPEGTYAHASDISADGRYVALSIETADGRRRAAVLEVATGKQTFVSSSDWEQRTADLSPDGRTLLVVSNVDGREELMTYDLVSRKASPLPVPVGVNTSGFYILTLPQFSPDGRSILLSHTSGSAPLEYWVYDIARGESRQVTKLASMDPRHLPKTQLVHYRSKDGLVISAFLWMPYNLERNGKAPAILYPHGGPTSQTYDQFDRKAAALASRGYVVLAPNFRGSSGYGKEFLDANRHDLGGGDLQDVVAGAKFLIDTGYVDASKVGINGGSYGGYMTIMALAKTPEVWAAGVEEFGIVNWNTMWEHGAPQNRRYQSGLIGDPVQNKDVYERVNPTTYLHQLRAPLLVLQGVNDPRVPKLEAEQLVEFIKKNGRVGEGHFYADEGHGYSKRENQIDSLERVIAWFDRYLKGK